MEWTTGVYIMKRILTAGTFDILHPSHLYLLEKKYDFNAELYIILSTDEFNTLIGGIQ